MTLRDSPPNVCYRRHRKQVKGVKSEAKSCKRNHASVKRPGSPWLWPASGVLNGAALNPSGTVKAAEGFAARDSRELAQAPGAAGTPVQSVPSTHAVTQPATGVRVPVASGSPCFAIRKIDVSGAALVAAERIDSVLKPFLRPDRKFGDVQCALEALERTFLDSVFGSVQVFPREQELACMARWFICSDQVT